MPRKSNYDKAPFVLVPRSEGRCVEGWQAIIGRLGSITGVLAVESYPGVDTNAILQAFEPGLHPALVIDTSQLMLKEEEIERLVEPFLGGDDPVFGFLSDLEMPAFFDATLTAKAQTAISETEGLVLVVGPGATLIHKGDTLIYADLPRWEAQGRFRRNEADNLGAHNRAEKWSSQYKRSFFVDWRVADRWKRPLISRWDFVLDTNDSRCPKLAEGQAVRDGLEECLRRPFRVVPFFDPAPWGGQWMKEVCNLDRSESNYGWCFDCVPEENSLVLGFGEHRFEIPAIDLVFYQPQNLLGEKVFEKFGDEFPIRFDFLDTISGGNLSLQVHPTNEYIRETFGMAYTQDESYYILDAGPKASVYLGIKEGVMPETMLSALEDAEDKRAPFDAERFTNRWPAKKHDHFLIPAGTVHCSGAEAMVLEISATPYIFTFKLWDWERLGLDGTPRPIYLEHGRQVIDWNRDTKSTRENLINRVDRLEAGPDWFEERTGLHESQFIETRRHWFTGPVEHHTRDGVNVLNLVEGEAAIVESPTNAFEPFVVHYAETFIVPAAVGPYIIRPIDLSYGQALATIKAFVRTNTTI